MRHQLITALLVWAAACAHKPDDLAVRRAQVAERGAEVMPFDLARTQHAFQSLPDGGLQTVTALSAGDTVQIGLIRAHLAREAERFASGNFDSPETIHGHAMPGLAELREGAAKIRVVFTPIEGGATLR